VLTGLLTRISEHAAKTHALNVTTIFRGMGHIGEVVEEVLDYAAAARLPGVEKICEVGFNAGHSAAVLLFANPNAHYVAFDLGDMVWTASQVEHLQRLFPDRITYIKGPSQVSLKEMHANRSDFQCDLWSIDGDHSANAVHDFEWARAMSRQETGYILADDCTDSFPAVKEIWRRQIAEKKLIELSCREADGWYGGYRKGWCLGRWVRDTSYTCRRPTKP
jgi:hypothetical protein